MNKDRKRKEYKLYRHNCMSLSHNLIRVMEKVIVQTLMKMHYLNMFRLNMFR